MKIGDGSFATDQHSDIMCGLDSRPLPSPYPSSSTCSPLPPPLSLGLKGGFQVDGHQLIHPQPSVSLSFRPIDSVVICAGDKR